MFTTIARHMTPLPLAIGAHESFAAAHRLMRAHGIRHLPVMRGGALVGVVSMGDLHLAESMSNADPASVRVEEHMTPDPYVVAPSAFVGDVLRVMAQRKLGCVPVVDMGRVVGIFTAIDALRALADAFDEGKGRLRASSGSSRRKGTPPRRGGGATERR